ncbi:MAG: biotin--[acetyl-CoA-carboxylase] ligase [Sphingomonadales bacterium]|nr:biotin--[acetyl-CoA-carboxylase] ligase [Sphingomonadales bacterium]
MPHPSANIGEPFISFSQVGSTNDEAREAIQKGLATHGMTFFSSNQVAGRGQRGKTWLSEPGASVALTALIKPDFLTVLQQFELNKAMALAVWDTVADLTGKEDLRIKWPNDLYWKDKKLGGILIESVLTSSGQWSWALVGIGLNCNQRSFDRSLLNPVSLAQISDIAHDPNLVARRLCVSLQLRLEQLRSKNTAQIEAQYEQLLYKKDQVAHFRTGNRQFSAVVKGVSRTGELRLEGESTAYATGSIEWLLHGQ